LPSVRPEKLAFSSCAIESVVAGFQSAGRRKILACGIEAHVCVLQTVLDLLALGFTVFVAVDAIGSRYRRDCEAAIRRMEQAGAVPVTVEMAAFELTGVAGTPLFKDISRLVQQRMQAIGADLAT
jgi:nicotinamidase-related amidase